MLTIRLESAHWRPTGFRRSIAEVADLYSLVHREAGPVSTFTTREEAEAELAAVLEDAPDWRPDVWVEPLVVSE